MDLTDLYEKFCTLILNRQKTVRIGAVQLTVDGKPSLPNNCQVLYISNPGNVDIQVNGFTILEGRIITMGGVAYDFSEQDTNIFEVTFGTPPVEPNPLVEFIYKVEVGRKNRPVPMPPVDAEL